METRSNVFLQLSLFSLLAYVAADTARIVDTMNDLIIQCSVVSGRNVSIEEVPHQVSLHFPERNFCGGSIISNQWVVTAAQCVSYPPNSTTVLAGSAMSSGSSLHMAMEIIVHPNFTLNSYGVPVNNVAVLKVSPPFKLDTTRKPIGIFKKNEVAPPGSDAIISGWGATVEGGNMSEVLRAVRLPIVSKQFCDKAYNEIVHLPEEKICATVLEGGKGACQGDDGGPVTIGNRLAGIVSWTFGCGRKGYPDVYTEVAAFNDWIVSQTGIMPDD